MTSFVLCTQLITRQLFSKQSSRKVVSKVFKCQRCCGDSAYIFLMYKEYLEKSEVFKKIPLTIYAPGTYKEVFKLNQMTLRLTIIQENSLGPMVSQRHFTEHTM